MPDPTAPQCPAPGADPAPGRAPQGDTGLRDPHDPLLPDAERIAEMRRRNARAAFDPDLRLLIQINMEDVPLLLYAAEQQRKRAEEAGAAVERVRALHAPEEDPRRVRDCRGCRTVATFRLYDECKTLAALEPKETPQ